MTFGEKIKYLRKQIPLSCENAVSLLDIPKSTLWRYEKSETVPKAKKKYESFAELFGCTVEDLMDDSVEIRVADFKDRIKGLREARKLSVEDVINATGITVYADMESGKLLPDTIDEYRILAETLVCSVSYLVIYDERFEKYIEEKPVIQHPISPELAEKRAEMLETAFRLFTERNIDSVSLADITDACGRGRISLYRYFNSKTALVMELSVKKWTEFREENQRRRPDIEKNSAAEIFEFYLDSFLELYRNHKDLLRFNQFFNVYIRSEKIDADTMKPYQEMIREFRKPFHLIYEKAKVDHTIKIDESEDEMFSTTLHLMLAVVTRYAVGLVYQPEKDYDPEKELLKQKKALMIMYNAP